MNSKDVLSFVRNPDFMSPKGVHDRLYYDFTRRTHKNRLLESVSCSTVRLASPGRSIEFRIEDSLMQKQMASKNKLSKLKVKYQAEEMKEVRNVPKINEMSRMIAIKSEGKLKDIRSTYITSILNNSRFIKMNESRNDRSVKRALIKIDRDQDQVLTDFSYDAKKEYLQVLRKAVQMRAQVFQPEEPPNILEMDVVDRGNFWTDLKKKKLENLRKQVSEDKLKFCTFRPKLVPRIEIYKQHPRSESANLSYAEIHMKRREKSAERLALDECSVKNLDFKRVKLGESIE